MPPHNSQMGPVACQVNPRRFHHFLSEILLSVFDELFFQPPMSVSERVEKRVGSFSRRRQGREGGLQGLSHYSVTCNYHIRTSISSHLRKWKARMWHRELSFLAYPFISPSVSLGDPVRNRRRTETAARAKLNSNRRRLSNKSPRRVSKGGKAG